MNEDNNITLELTHHRPVRFPMTGPRAMNFGEII